MRDKLTSATNNLQWHDPPGGQSPIPEQRSRLANVIGRFVYQIWARRQADLTPISPNDSFRDGPRP